MPSRKGKPNRIQGYYRICDVYKEYKKNVDKGSIFDIKRTEFYDIVTSVFQTAMDDIIENNGEVVVGSGLGKITCKKYKTSPEKAKFDFKTYNETGHRVPHLNLHTNGYYVRFHWNKSKIRVANIQWYCFDASRARTRELSRSFGSGKTDYFPG